VIPLTLAPLGFIGGGVMAEAIVARLVGSGLYAPELITVSDPSVERLQLLEQAYGVSTTPRNQELVARVSHLVLAIKPQVLNAIAPEVSALAQPPALVISILAGTPLARLESLFPKSPVIRAMPNTPATVGVGMTVIALGSQVGEQERGIAEAIFQCVGEVLCLEESYLDAVTGLSGSGPAFVAVAVEALADAGVSVGLPRAVALKLATQTVRGTAELIHQGELHPALLKDRVASPGGTTIAGLVALEQANFRHALIAAVQAAYHRSRALAQLPEA
jgi:pyrroline-5-carboxylate reductase